MAPVVNVNGRECLQDEAIMSSSEMLAKIKHLASVPDPDRLQRDGPAMQSREELADFCEEYDQMVKGYRLLKQNYNQLNENEKSLFQLAVDRMNNAAGSEPMLDDAKQPTWNYTFQLASYTSNDTTMKNKALAVAANSAYYIVLAGVIRRAMARRMVPRQQVTNALQAMEMMPLQSDMYQPQNVPAFDEVLRSEPVQFPLSFDDMSADGKALMKAI